MKYTTLIAALVLFLYSLLSNISENATNEINDDVLTEKVVLRFLAATAAFDEYYRNNSTISGDVTEQVDYPDWLQVNDEIKMVITDGVGYVYTPASKGIYSKLLLKTEGSSLMGYTDEQTINTPSGKIPKPSYISADSIVYVR